MTPCDWLALMLVGLVFWYFFVEWVAVPLFERFCYWFIQRQYGKDFADEVERRLGEERK